MTHQRRNAPEALSPRPLKAADVASPFGSYEGGFPQGLRGELGEFARESSDQSDVGNRNRVGGG